MKRSLPFTLSEAADVCASVDHRDVAPGSVFSTILLDLVLRRVAPGAVDGLVVDVGCGSSPHRHLVPSPRYVGIDRTVASGAQVPLVLADGGRLPLRSAVADVVLCTEVIEHVPDERALTRELARIASPAAGLLLSAPFVHGLHEAPYDYRRLTSVGLCSVLAESGWVTEEIRPVGGTVVVSADSALRWLDRMLRRPVLRTLGPSSGAYRVVRRFSRWTQTKAALLVASSPMSALAAIDPGQPNPRLTLGYVVRARRPSPGSSTVA